MTRGDDVEVWHKIKTKLTPRVIVLITVWVLIVVGMGVYYKARFFLSGEYPWTVMFALTSTDSLFGYIVATLLVFGCELVGRGVDGLTRSRMTTIQAATLRYFACALFGVVAVFAATYAWFTLLFGYETSTNFLIDMFFISITMPLFVNGLMETFHYQGEIQREKLAKEVAAREALLAEFEALRNQVSPHFLFNSFATLSQIIEADPKKAAEFLDDLSDVFRYVLQNRDSDSVPLFDELNAVKALLQVHQVRVPGGLVVDIDIDDKKRAGLIPPMALYTLVENALKHNIVSADKPLNIKIGVDADGMLVVENTLQPRRTRHSLGTGLKNLDRRFQLLLKKGLDIERSREKFVVRAPLIMAVS